MSLRQSLVFILASLALPVAFLEARGLAQGSSLPSVSSPSAKNSKGSAMSADSGINAGAVANGAYRNKALGLNCKIPAGWVLRTEEMNEQQESDSGSGAASGENAHPSTGSGQAPVAKSATRVGQPMDGRVLLAAFSRPPEARGEDVNASIVIAAESVAAYSALTEAVQYFEPLKEVAQAQGFAMDEDPYEIAVGTKTLVRGDFHKNVGTRVMRQSTLVMLARGYAVSITVIGGTDDEVEELVDGLDFSAGKSASK